MPPASDSQRATSPLGTGAPPRPPSSNSYRDSALGVFVLLLALRIVNAWTTRSFFQPDEFFQSLEPAWQLAFGPSANAYITWVNPPSAIPRLVRALPFLPIGSSLTTELGVENAVAVVSASSTIRGSLSAGGQVGCPLWHQLVESSPSSPSCTQGYASAICGPVGRLHLEACRKSIRPRQSHSMDNGTKPAHAPSPSISDIQFCVIIARAVNMQSVAVVLLNTDPVQLH